MSAQPVGNAAGRRRAPRAARPRRSVALLLSGVCLLAGCTAGANPAPTSAPSPDQSPSAGVATGPTTTPSSTTAAPTTSPAQAPAVVLVGARFGPQATFRSPTGNLACRLSGGVICRAAEHTWTSQAAESQTDCAPAERTSGVQILEDAVRERSDCYDQVEDPGAVLEYGHGLELDGVRCVSEQRGMTCVRFADGIGFSISRDDLSLTPRDSPLLRAPAGTLGGANTTAFPPGVQIAFLVGDLANCVLSADLASCTVDTDAAAPPDEPCDLDQAPTTVLKGNDQGRLVRECRGDANPGQEQLRTGESAQVGDLRCTAGTTQLRCAHLGGSQHGFEVDPSSFRGF